MALNKYALKKPHLRLAAFAVDTIGYLFHKPAAKQYLHPNRILVVRRDQLGDIIQTLPFFDGLVSSFPEAHVDFLTTSAGTELFRFARPHVRTVTREEILNTKYDCAFDLRGDIRLICQLRKLRPHTLIGYGSTGGGFLLDVEPAWEQGQHAIDKNLKLLEAIGGKAVEKVPHIKVKSSVQPGRPISIAVHPDAGTDAKKWPLERFVQTIDRLMSEIDVRISLVGLNRSIGEEIAHHVKSPVNNLMGKTTLAELIGVLSESDGLLSNDSGPAHLMAALGKPVWIIWSGTADASIWAPRGSMVNLIENPVACAPCSRPICNVDGHPCLTGISVDDVTAALLAYFHPSFSRVKS